LDALFTTNVFSSFLITEGSHLTEPFFIQVNHLISSNGFSKQVINPADEKSFCLMDCLQKEFLKNMWFT